MTTSMRFVHVVLFALAAATATAAQTLTVNKFQQNLAGAPIATAGVGMKMNYVIVITSSDITKNPAVTVTDTLPTGFVPLSATCTRTGDPTTTCPPIPSIPATPVVSASSPVVFSGGVIHADSASTITITITGYFTAPGTFVNHAEAQRAGETIVESTAKADATLNIPRQTQPVSVTLTKSVTPTTGATGTPAGATTYHFTIKVANSGATDVYLGGFSLSDAVKAVSGPAVDFKYFNFACADPACPSPLPSAQSGPVGFGSGTQAFQIPWSPTSVIKAGSFFLLTFDATFDTNATCGGGQTVAENDVFLALGGSLTSIAASTQLTSSLSLPACPPPLTLNLTKVQVSPANPVAWGAVITYQISFKNGTGAPLTNLSVTDSLSPAASAPVFNATIATPPACSPACTFGSTTFPATVQVAGFSQLFTAKFASIAINQQVTITLKVKYEAPCATGSGTPIAIPNFAQNSLTQDFAFVTTTMQPLPDCGLKVTKRLTTANPVVLGLPVEFQITYTNPFSQPVAVRTLEDVVSLTSLAYGDLPIKITASSCQATPAGSVTPLPQPLAMGSAVTVKTANPAWSGLPLLAYFTPITFGPGASLTCTIQFVPQQPTLCQGAGNPQLVNWAFIDTGFVNTSSPTPPPVSAQAAADLPLCRTVSVKKNAPNPQSFTPGATVTYTVLVTNNNPNDPVSGLHLDDPLPPGFTAVSASCAPSCSTTIPSPGDVQAAIPSIPAGGSVTVTITVKAPATGGSSDNVATASFDQQGNFFAGPGNSLSSTANVQVLTPRLTKSFLPGQGNQATMTLTLTNVGGNPQQQGIAFTDTLSTGIQVIGSPSTTCKVGTVTVAGNAITFQGQMQAGEATCTVTVQVKGAGCNNRSNISGTANIDPSGVNAMLNVTECPLSLTVGKTLVGAPPGFTGTFTFIVTCATPSGMIQQALTITWPSATATLSGIPAGSTCTVSEDPKLPSLPAGYSWSGVPVSIPTNGVVVIGPDGKNEVSFTNVIRACDVSAHLQITKRVEGAPQGFAGTFTFDVACWSGTNLITRQVQITVPGASTVTVNGLPSGSSCTVTEVSPLPALPAGWFWQAPSYLPASGHVDLVGTCCPEVVVIDPAKFCCGNGGPVNPDTQPGKPASNPALRP